LSNIDACDATLANATATGIACGLLNRHAGLILNWDVIELD
jgi:hypothetical protein